MVLLLQRRSKVLVGLGQLIDKDLAVDTDCTGFLEDIGHL